MALSSQLFLHKTSIEDAWHGSKDSSDWNDTKNIGYIEPMKLCALGVTEAAT